MPLHDAAHALAWLRFTLRPGVPPGARRKLLKRFGSPHAANRASAAEVAMVCGADVAHAFSRGAREERVAAALRWLEEPGHHLLALGDAGYPPMLLEIPDPPTVLYARGRIDLLAKPGIAIVGSRSATPRGRNDAHDLAGALSRQGLCVVSGMARGIDAAAHRGALTGPGSSIAVLGTGVDIVYPPEHDALAKALADGGCLVSELPLGRPPESGNFPRRNRLISGLSRGVVVVEASTKSGSLITARCALDQNRDVFAMPGSIHATLSKGCHALIKHGAKLVECAADVLEEYGFAMPPSAGAVAGARESPHPLLHAMGHTPVCVDQLVDLTGLEAAEVSAQLVTLQVEGRVETLPGGFFQRRGGHAEAAL